MFRIISEMPLATLALPSVSAAGAGIVTIVAKRTFAIESSAVYLAAEQAPVRTADEPWNARDAKSSLRLPSDAMPEKVGTDVVVVGSAVSRRPAAFVDVGVAVRDLRAVVRVHGPRVWVRGLTGQVSAGRSAPFLDEAIVYEHAWGGTSEDLSVVEQRNPIGRGVASRAAELAGKLAPQIESPNEPITGADGHYAPVGLGAIPTNWEPRVGYAGSLDERWRRERAPLMPLDFNPLFYSCAHPSLRAASPLMPGDQVRIEGMRAEGPIAFSLPALRVRVTGKYDDGHLEIREPAVDTLLVLTKELTFELTCRSTFPLGRGRRTLRELVLHDHAEDS